MTRRAAALLAAAALAACAVGKRATDPEPTLPDLEPAPVGTAPAIPLSTVTVAGAGGVPIGSTVPVAGSVPAVPGRPKARPDMKAGPKGALAAPSVPTPRAWGGVAITTSIVSPAQLMGPEVPWSPEYQRLPVFPEKLVMEMSWGLLKVGEATLSVNRLVNFNGRAAYHLVMEAKSNSFCDTFYRVRDLNEAWLDARTLTSLGYSKKLREGHFFRDEWVLYDREVGTFVQRRTNKDGSFSVRTGTIPAQVQDVLSSIYFVRSRPLPPGGELVVDVNTPENWPLSIKVKERETVKVPAGRFRSVLVEPELRKEGLFVQKGKRLRLWLSDDDKRRTLLMKVEVFFGHVTAELKEML